MVDYYPFAKKIVLERFSEDNFLYPFFVCAIYGLLTKFRGNGMLIRNLFRKADIIIEKGSVKEILKRHQIQNEVDQGTSNEENLVITATGNQGHDFIQDNGDFLYSKVNPYIVCSLDYYNPANLLNAFCHEMAHLIKGEIDDHYFETDGENASIIIRSGLSHDIYSYHYPATEMELQTSCVALEEAINCIQTTEVMREILALGEFVDDPKIKAYIDSLDRDDMLSDSGYGNLVAMVRPLWECDSFKQVVEDNMLFEGVDNVIEHFDGILGEGSFNSMAFTLDMALGDMEEKDDEHLSMMEKKFAEIVRQYKTAIKVMEKE